MIRISQRRGFTLVEMLVVMAIIVLITAGAMLVVPAALNKDRSTDAVTSLRGWLEIAQARAARDGSPRGLRLIVDLSKPSPSTSPTGSDERLWVTEVQYIESPPVLVYNQNPPYPNGFVNSNNVSQSVPGGTPGAIPHPETPRVEFRYELEPSLPGTIARRRCFLRGLTLEQANKVVSAATGTGRPSLWLPVLGTWHRIFATVPDSAGVVIRPEPPVNPRSYYVEILLSDPSDLTSGYPDTQLGAATHYVTYHFGIYGPPRPLLGEPTMQMPTNTCVDLNDNSLNNANDRVSSPGLTPSLPTPPDYDILFAPNGSLAFTPLIGGDSHIFLCVRDPRKGSPMNLFSAQVLQGGEMMILGIKARSGAIAVQPVDMNGDPYSFARQAVSGQ